MVTITSTYAVVFDFFDFPAPTYGTPDFLNDTFEVFNGVTYEDVLQLDLSPLPVSYTLAGTGFEFSSGDTATDGTLELMHLVIPSLSYNLSIAGLSLSLVDVQAASETESFADDLALWAPQLSGDDTFLLSDFDDSVKGLGGNDTLRGNGGADTLLGGEGRDQVFGGSGRDKLHGDSGSDKLFGGAGNDRLAGGAGSDKLYGGSGNDKLFGGVGPDQLFGGRGADLLHSGRGADQMTGGSGADTFLFRSAADSFNHRADRITDFESGVDLIDISALGDSFNLIGTGGFSGSGAGDEVLITTNSAGNTLIRADLDGDGASDFMIVLEDFTGPMTEADFIL